TAPAGTYTLSLHDALPISARTAALPAGRHTVASRELDPSSSTRPSDVLRTDGPVVSENTNAVRDVDARARLFRQSDIGDAVDERSEEHTSALQSRENLVCR